MSLHQRKRPHSPLSVSSKSSMSQGRVLLVLGFIFSILVLSRMYWFVMDDEGLGQSDEERKAEFMRKREQRRRARELADAERKNHQQQQQLQEAEISFQSQQQQQQLTEDITIIVPARSDDITDEQIAALLLAVKASPRFQINGLGDAPTSETTATTTTATTPEEEPEEGGVRLVRRRRKETQSIKKVQTRKASVSQQNRVREVIVVASTMALAHNLTKRFEELADSPHFFKRAESSGALQIQAPKINQHISAADPTLGVERKVVRLLSLAHLFGDGASRAVSRRVFFLAPTHIPRGIEAATSVQELAANLEELMLSEDDVGLVSCTTVDDHDIVIDNGQGVGFGRGKKENAQTLFVEKLMFGFSYLDQRVLEPHEVELASPYCLLVDSVVLKQSFSKLTKGGKTIYNAPPSAIDRAHVQGAIAESTDLRTVIALTTGLAKLLESAMGDITMKEVSDGSTRLRDLVRTSYRELMGAEKKIEEINAKYPRPPSESVDKSTKDELVTLEKELNGKSAGQRLTVLLPKMKGASELLTQVMKSEARGGPPDEPDEAVGYELSICAKELDKKILVSPIKTYFCADALPQTLRLQAKLEKEKLSMTSPAIELARETRLSSTYDIFGKRYHEARAISNDHRGGNIRVFWDTHCCHCCGFTNEIVHLVLPLQKIYNLHLMQESECYCPGFPGSVAQTIDRMFLTNDNYVNERLTDDEISVWISHRDPGAYEALRSSKRKPDYIIGRSMYEFSRMPKHHVEGANHYCDEVWVPAEWVRRMFISNGVKPDKLVIIPESVDVQFFNPTVHKKYALPPPEGSFRMWCNHDPSPEQESNYKFFSNFKWEDRKGWEILFEAYFSSFSANDRVSLYILTHIWFPGGPETYGDKHNATFLHSEVLNFAQKRFGVRTLRKMPHFCFLLKDLEETQMVQIYNSVDAFVLPTRGEGWGLPTIQAMAMGLPTISTNWGGQMEFLTSDTAFLIGLDGVEEIPFDSVYNWELGKKWGVPSLSDTRRAMKAIFSDPEYGKSVGRRAREHIVSKFSEEAVAGIIDKRLQSVRNIVLSRRSGT